MLNLSILFAYGASAVQSCTCRWPWQSYFGKYAIFQECQGLFCLSIIRRNAPIFTLLSKVKKGFVRGRKGGMFPLGVHVADSAVFWAYTVLWWYWDQNSCTVTAASEQYYLSRSLIFWRTNQVLWVSFLGRSPYASHRKCNHNKTWS